jgi:cysteine desulfurase/selenocysteine lyase
MPVSVQDLGADFVAFGAHKMLGPTGIGALWGRGEVLETMEPAEGGGSMIRDVQLHDSTWADVPHKFEAGTPPIAQAVGFGAAVDTI